MIVVMNPVPKNELDRIIELSEFDLDYGNLQDQFKDLTTLAARVAGTNISLVNLIDSFTSWTIANHGLPVEQLPREEAVCQYTIAGDDTFEVNDLSVDDRFKDKFYVTGDPHLRYYFGVPLRTSKGNNIGTLCMFHPETKPLTPEKTEMLKIIASEIVNRLQAYRVIQELKQHANDAVESKKRVAHDIRGPLGGIIGLARVIAEQGDENKMDEVLEFINLIYKSGHSLLELADEILSIEVPKPATQPASNEFNQVTLKEKLNKLYAPQAVNKKISFSVQVNSSTENVPFPKNKLLQIIGNLISNAMKFTPAGGSVTVKTDFKKQDNDNHLLVSVTDTGIGMANDQKEAILQGKGQSTSGTQGEEGYGFGLALVKHLVDGLKGTMQINTIAGQGTEFIVNIPIGS
jgi:signal transduction histidine kinase